MKCSPSTFVSALVYIDRAILRSSVVCINKLTIHRLLFAALVCACKFWDDVFFTNDYYAKVGGLKTADLSGLELNFLFALEFELHIATSEWQLYFEQLTLHVTDNSCLAHNSIQLETIDFAKIRITNPNVPPGILSMPSFRPMVKKDASPSSPVEGRVHQSGEPWKNSLPEDKQGLGFKEREKLERVKSDDSSSSISGTTSSLGPSPTPSSPSAVDWDDSECSNVSNAEELGKSIGEWDILAGGNNKKRELDRWKASADNALDVDMAHSLSPPYKKMSPTAASFDSGMVYLCNNIFHYSQTITLASLVEPKL